MASASGSTLTDLLREAAAGDTRAFDALIGPHLELAYRMSVTMLRDRALAEDAVQDAALSAWRALPRLREGSDVRAWFLTIVANRCRSQLRSRWFSVLRRGEVAQAAPDPTQAPVERADLTQALLGLDPVDRLAVYLRYCEDLSLDEVASALRLTSAAVRSRVYRAVKQLRLDLEVSR